MCKYFFPATRLASYASHQSFSDISVVAKGKYAAGIRGIFVDAGLEAPFADYWIIVL